MLRVAIACALACLLALPARAGDGDAPPDRGGEIQSFTFRHVDVKEANAILRTLVNLRVTAVDLDRNQLIVRDTREQLAIAREIVGIIDVPAPRWRLRLVAETSAGEEDLRTLPGQGHVEWLAGAQAPMLADGFSVAMDASPGPDHLMLSSEMSVAAGGDMGAQILRRHSQERWSLSDGESIELLAAEHPEARSALQAVLATSAPVERVRLVAERERARERSARR